MVARRSIAVASGLPGEGGSEVAARLAEALADAGHSTLLVDANTRRPRVHEFFGLAPGPGFLDLLRAAGNDEQGRFAEAVDDVLAGARIGDNLAVMPIGERGASAGRRFSRDEAAAQAVLRELSGRDFDYVLLDCTHEMDVMTKEIFGPVIPIMRVRDEEEAVRCANDSHLGLLAYVFTRDRERGKRLAQQIEAGTVMVNDVLSTYACPETPWGGVKHSGIGRTHSARGLRDLCQTRHVNYDRFATPRELWWYPYRDATYRALLRTARLLFGKRFWQR